MTTPSNSNSQMHNDIMAAGSKDHPPMLATGRYAQWQSGFMRYVDTKPNMKELKKCILNGPYAYIDAESEAIHMILSGIGDEIYSTIDACKELSEKEKEVSDFSKNELLSVTEIGRLEHTIRNGIVIQIFDVSNKTIGNGYLRKG
ncbi:hypothetical protein Tco_0138557 [Tanacetum coccineum]